MDHPSGAADTKTGSACMLGKGLDCAGRVCVACGWYTREAQRRKRLPLWRNAKGLWQKRIGKAPQD